MFSLASPFYNGKRHGFCILGLRVRFPMGAMDFWTTIPFLSFFVTILGLIYPLQSAYKSVLMLFQNLFPLVVCKCHSCKNSNLTNKFYQNYSARDKKISENTHWSIKLL